MPAFRTRVLLAAALATPAALSVLAPTAAAQPTGGFIVGLDYEGEAERTDSAASVVIFDIDDLSAPLFSVVLGYESNDTGSYYEDPAALTVDPATGNIYVAAFDGGDPGTVNTLFNGQEDTSGDLDLYKIDFANVYNEWANNANGSYVRYSPEAVPTDDLFGDPVFVDNNLQVLPGAVTKIGEVASSRAFAASTAAIFEKSLEFIDEDTLVFLDDDTTQDTDNVAANDHEIRIFKRGTSAPTYDAGTNEGGFASGTTENWTSTIVGRVNLDSQPDGSGGFEPSQSNPENFAAYRDPTTGITGVWISESDGGSNQPNDGPDGIPGTADDFFTGDDVAFFEIVNENGTAGNGYRDLQFFGASTTTPVITVDDNPVSDEFTNDGANDRIHVDPATGRLLIVESGFFDEPRTEPSVIEVNFTSYDDNGNISLPEFPYAITELAGNLPGDDDGTVVTDGRSTVFDYANNDVYFFDRDNPGAGGSFVADWWKLDLDTGETTLVATDADNLILFDQGDHFEFFFLEDAIAGLLGDFNGNGSVEQNDLNLVLSNWGQTRTFEDPGGTVFSTAIVDQEELNLVLGEWGSTSAPSFEGFSVPEPGALAVLGGLALAGLRRRSA
ncbi:MAG: PEP-CTERM sorting domain-containing protein [Planctomycetota bacterium]